MDLQRQLLRPKILGDLSPAHTRIPSVAGCRTVSSACRIETRQKSEPPRVLPTRPPSARAAAVAAGGYASIADGGELNQIIEREAREAR